MLKLHYSNKYYLAYVYFIIVLVASFFFAREMDSVILLVNSFVLTFIGLYVVYKYLTRMTTVSFDQGVGTINRPMFREFSFKSADIELISAYALIIKNEKFVINQIKNRTELIDYLIREIDTSKSLIDSHEIKKDYANDLGSRILSGAVFYRDMSVMEKSLKRMNKNTLHTIVIITIVFLISILNLSVNIFSIFE